MSESVSTFLTSLKYSFSNVLSARDYFPSEKTTQYLWKAREKLNVASRSVILTTSRRLSCSVIKSGREIDGKVQ